VVFAYPISENLYKEWKAFEDKTTSFVNITLAPKLEVCLTNRGQRELEEWEINRIKQMYEEGYHNSDFADLIVDNSNKTPDETVDEILTFLNK
ncbi:MAG: shikimate kinase, partial [Alphaproteobacteria bacterium]|nr:shikimate kinase [Alphaproteobacteria bacterium]